MKKRILILDRYEAQIQRIVQEVWEAAGKVREGVEIYTANNLKEAEKIMRQRDIDLLILDTVYKEKHLKERQGIHWVERLRKIEKYIPLPVIFITCVEKYEEYAYTELNCMGYFPRNFESEKLQKVLKKALNYRTFPDEEGLVWIRQSSMYYPVKKKDIVYVRADGRLAYIYLKDGTELKNLRKSLKEILDMIECRNVVRCSKGILVNTDYIEKTERAGSAIALYANMGDFNVGEKFREAINDAMKYRI